MNDETRNAVLLDANVVIDLTGEESAWREWSWQMAARIRSTSQLLINPIVYAEVSVGFATIERFEADLSHLAISFDRLPRAALFLAGRQFQTYRLEHKGPKTSLLPDFLIGAHAAVLGIPLLTRDTRRYRTYYPRLTLISPETV
ncbi:MAG: putative nucleic acid-binding protein [Rhodothermales bacterium]|jgi:predicted nucleic acid-binding protein